MKIFQKSTDFSRQRRRWLATQFIYFKRYYKTSLKELFKNRNVNFFDKVFQMIVPPRILLLGLSIIITIVYIVLETLLDVDVLVSKSVWFTITSFVIVTFLLALPKSFYNLSTLKAMLSIPSAFFRMFFLLFKLKGANKKFIHTSHGVLKD